MQEKIKEPIAPEIVLFGLILVNLGPLNVLPNTKPPISDATQPIKNTNNNILSCNKLEKKKKNKQ